MPLIKVRQGDSIDSIAQRYGHFWETIWNHPENAELKQRRVNPDVLDPEDEVFVPEIRLKQESRPDADKHVFRRKGIPERISIQVKEEGEPVANEDYVLEVEEQRYSGQTDSDGMIEHPIDPAARSGKLTLGTGSKARAYRLRFGHLDPASEVSGVQARLKNLGYDGGEISGRMTEQTRQALEAFQTDVGLTVSGEVDGPTEDALEDEHKS
jgi:hypothetical protein